MPTVRNSFIVMGVCVAVLVPASSAWARGGRGGGRGGGTNGGGMRGPTVNPAIQQDVQAVDQANVSVTKAKAALDTAVNKATVEFHKGADYTAAKKAVDDAGKDVDKTRKAALANL